MPYPTRADLPSMTASELRQAAFEFAMRHDSHALSSILRAKAWSLASGGASEEPARAIELRLLLDNALASVAAR